MAGESVYTVRLEAWNCTCAAFTFAAFSTRIDPGSSFSSLLLGSDHLATVNQGAWEFGGLSLDGSTRGDWTDERSQVPCCKHLLACLLEQRCKNVLGCHVKGRMIGREEAAGVEENL